MSNSKKFPDLNNEIETLQKSKNYSKLIETIKLNPYI